MISLSRSLSVNEPEWMRIPYISPERILLMDVVDHISTGTIKVHVIIEELDELCWM